MHLNTNNRVSWYFIHQTERSISSHCTHHFPLKIKAFHGLCSTWLSPSIILTIVSSRKAFVLYFNNNKINNCIESIQSSWLLSSSDVSYFVLSCTVRSLHHFSLSIYSPWFSFSSFFFLPRLFHSSFVLLQTKKLHSHKKWSGVSWVVYQC